MLRLHVICSTRTVCPGNDPVSRQAFAGDRSTQRRDRGCVRRANWKKPTSGLLFSALVGTAAAVITPLSFASQTTGFNATPLSSATTVVAAAASTTIEDILAGESLEPDYNAIELQIDANETDDIERLLADDIREIEVAFDRYSPALIEPLRLMGKLLHADQRFSEAADSFARATQIARLESGLHSPEQLDLVYAEIDSLIEMERLLEANSRHEYAFTVARRAHGNFSTEIVPVLLKLADWYVQTGNLFAARGHFLHARNLLSARQSTTNSDAMITALRGLARSFRDERFPTFVAGTSEEAVELAEKNAIYNNQSPSDIQTLQLSVNAFQRGTQALKNIVAIEERRLIVLALTRQQQAANATVNEIGAAATNPDAAQANLGDQPAAKQAAAGAQRRQGDPTANPDTIVLTATGVDPSQVVVSDVLDPLIRDTTVDKSAFLQSIVELADWYLLMEKSKQAFAYYRHAYRIAAADPRTDVEQLFGEPVLLYAAAPRDPSIPSSTNPNARQTGFVDLSYNIDANGSVRRMKTLNSEPKGLMVFQVRRSIADARYRPRIVSGFPQSTDDFSFRHSFEYVPKSPKPAGTLSRGQGD